MPNQNDPREAVFQDPMSKLNPELPPAQGHAAQPEMLYRHIQYLVEEGDWAQQGEEVEAPSKTEERGT